MIFFDRTYQSYAMTVRVFGYKLHMSCSTGGLIVPLSADFSSANIPDNKPYDGMIFPLADMLQNIIADPAYDDFKLYESTTL